MTTNTDLHGAMPELPEPRAIRAGSSFPKVYAKGFTADQVREYARGYAAKLIEELRVTDELLSARQSVLDAIPACEAHGPCVPHALEWIKSARAAIQQAAVPDGLIELGKAIANQDNRATDAPIFIVQQKRSYVTEDGYNDSRYEWRETESGDYSGPDDEELMWLDKFYANEGHEPKGWRRFAIMDVWEFVTACFTEKGCKDYIAINGHNLKESRIYAEGSYRNEEFRSLRKTLIALAASPAPTKQQPDSQYSGYWPDTPPRPVQQPALGGGEGGGVPLSEARIEELADIAFKEHFEDKNDNFHVALVRSVEAAHGIKEAS